MKIAIIGTGISGNVIARLLCEDYDVHVFETNSHVGGHAQTVDIDFGDRTLSIDIGFMVFNERTYPNFCRLLDMLEVPAQNSDMSFSVRCARSGLEYAGSSLNGLFAQRRNVFRPAFHRMLRDILRFNREALEVLGDDTGEITLGEYLNASRYGGWFIEKYLVPMAAAIWSCPPGQLLRFPAHFVIAFFQNHGLMQLRDRPQWKTIHGRSRIYVEALIAPFKDRIRLDCPVEAVFRHPDHVVVKPRNGLPEIFDRVIFATHADQALSMLQDADQSEREILAGFPYQRNDAILHTDTSILPRRRRARASWNYHIPPEEDRPVAVTYDLSRLQSVDSPASLLLTLNSPAGIDPAKVLRRFKFHHPRYTRHSLKSQSRFADINGRNRTYFCGAYWGYGFHEDGVNSALAVGKYFGKSLETCTVASTKDESATAVSHR